MTNRNVINLAKTLANHRDFAELALELKDRMRIRTTLGADVHRFAFSLGKREAVDDIIKDIMDISVESDKSESISDDDDFAIDPDIHRLDK